MSNVNFDYAIFILRFSLKIFNLEAFFFPLGWTMWNVLVNTNFPFEMSHDFHLLILNNQIKLYCMRVNSDGAT